MPNIQITLEGDDRTPGVTSLYRWLHTDLEHEHSRDLALESKPPERSSMGAEQFIQILLEYPEVIEAVAISLAKWFETLRRRPTLRMEYRGRTYTIENVSADELRRIFSSEGTGDQQDEEDSDGER